MVVAISRLRALGGGVGLDSDAPTSIGSSGERTKPGQITLDTDSLSASRRGRTIERPAELRRSKCRGRSLKLAAPT